ncbi:hypothetical protein KCU93_g4881, partial [Aureobasidium melanogenum]
MAGDRQQTGIDASKGYVPIRPRPLAGSEDQANAQIDAPGGPYAVTMQTSAISTTPNRLRHVCDPCHLLHRTCRNGSPTTPCDRCVERKVTCVFRPCGTFVQERKRKRKRKSTAEEPEAEPEKKKFKNGSVPAPGFNPTALGLRLRCNYCHLRARSCVNGSNTTPCDNCKQRNLICTFGKRKSIIDKETLRTITDEDYTQGHNLGQPVDGDYYTQGHNLGQLTDGDYYTQEHDLRQIADVNYYTQEQYLRQITDEDYNQEQNSGQITDGDYTQYQYLRQIADGDYDHEHYNQEHYNQEHYNQEHHNQEHYNQEHYNQDYYNQEHDLRQITDGDHGDHIQEHNDVTVANPTDILEQQQVEIGEVEVGEPKVGTPMMVMGNDGEYIRFSQEDLRIQDEHTMDPWEILAARNSLAYDLQGLQYEIPNVEMDEE